MFKMEFSPAETGGALLNSVKDVETEPHPPHAMARITAVKQTPSNYPSAVQTCLDCTSLTLHDRQIPKLIQYDL